MADEGNDPNHALSRIERGPGVLLKSRYLRRSFMLTGRKLALTLAFTALVAVAFGASCRGFFPKAKLTAIGITPANQTITDIAPNNTKQFSAVGTFDDGNSGSTPVTWSSDSTTTVASIDSNSGLATAVGVGTATITATSTILPNISGTTQLTVVA